MEFQFEIKEILPARVTVIESKDSNSILQIHGLKTINHHCEANDWICLGKHEGHGICNSTSNHWDAPLSKKKEHLEKIIDEMGLASARAQELASPVTTLKKLLNSYQQKLYIIRDMEEPFTVIGMLKVGQKRLFVCTDMNAQHEVDATCVLDFYVHESRQRCGYGHELFESMLKNENVEPAKLAIDRPSYKLLEFLSKHYNLTDPKPQNNNFVVYAGFLERADLHHPQKFSKSKNIEELDSLQTESACASNDQKCSCIGECHHGIENNATLDDYFKKQRTPKTYKTKGTSFPYINKHEQSWGVFDAMHSYSGNKNFPNSSNCTLTPMDNENARVERKMSQLQSSWNVLGVKPLDYSTTEKKSD